MQTSKKKAPSYADCREAFAMEKISAQLLKHPKASAECYGVLTWPLSAAADGATFRYVNAARGRRQLHHALRCPTNGPEALCGAQCRDVA